MRSERVFRVLRNELSELRPLSGWVRETAKGLGLPATTCHDIDLCLHEAVSNIIRHGCSDEVDHRVTVRFEAAPEGTCIQVEDDARPFDPLVVPLPSEAAALEDARTSGYGIPLMRVLASELRYECVDGRNLLTLVFQHGMRAPTPSVPRRSGPD